jgi:hypothetical protein
MNPQPESGPTDSNIAHDHVKRISDEFYRLRAKLNKSETGTTEMNYETSVLSRTFESLV